MTTRRIVSILAVLSSLSLPMPSTPPRPEGCSFSLGFAALRHLIPYRVGRCLASARYDPRLGEVLQDTTGGVLIWRKANNWTGFTDGSRTWVLGPHGLQQRLSTQRFRWEATPGDWTLTRARLGTVTGRVLARPCTPVESVTNPCPGRPVADARVDFSPATGGQTVVVTSNRAGAYTVRLWTGTYTVRVEHHLFYLRPHSQTVAVLAGRTVTVDLVIDSGLR
jgi:Carboxypeptidase regulatory-like domain